MAIEWSDKYKIGDKDIDHQHQFLFRLANEFLSAQAKPELQSCATKLFKYCDNHFAYEEMLMDRYSVPFKNEHVESHKHLLEQLYRLSHHISNDSLNRMELESFIKNWALHHIPVMDSKLAEYLSYGNTDIAELMEIPPLSPGND